MSLLHNEKLRILELSPGGLRPWSWSATRQGRPRHGPHRLGSSLLDPGSLMARPAALMASLRPPIIADRPLLISGIYLRKRVFPERTLAGLWTMELGYPRP